MERKSKRLTEQMDKLIVKMKQKKKSNDLDAMEFSINIIGLEQSAAIFVSIDSH